MIIQDKFYAEMPYMMDSLESIMTYQPLNSPADIPLIMSNRHRYGFTVDCIAIALKETLKGLSYLHGERLFHKNISAGHVFVKHSHPQILLAFAGTMYEHNICNHDTREWISSSSSITAWAAAPEVVNFGDDYYSCKSDIWLIGITALQLACGGLPVSHRQDLDIMIKILMKQSKLTSWDVAPNDYTTYGTRKLSKNFWNMVKICLAPDPAKRPTADQLLKHKFFKKCGTLDDFFKTVLLSYVNRFAFG